MPQIHAFHDAASGEFHCAEEETGEGTSVLPSDNWTSVDRDYARRATTSRS